MLCFNIISSVHAAASKSCLIVKQTLHSTMKTVNRQHTAPAAHCILFVAAGLQGHSLRSNIALVLQDWEHHLQYGTLKDLVAPRLQKKIVLQQVEEAAAAGVDAAVIKKPDNGRTQQSLAQLAKHDSMVDL